MSDINTSYTDSPEEPEQTLLTPPTAEETPAEEPLESEVVDELTAWQSSIDTRSSFVRHVAGDYPAWLEHTFGRRIMFYPYTEQRFGVFLDGQRIQWGRMNKRGGVSITLPLTKDGPAIERLKDLTPQSGFYVSTRGSQFALHNDADYAVFQEAMRIIGGVGPEQPKAWIFQSNPAYYNLEGALQKFREIRWLVNRYEDEVKPGDTVYLWEAGANAGIVAAARVLVEPHVYDTDDVDTTFYRDPERLGRTGKRALLRIEKVLAERISRETVQQEPALRDMELLKLPRGTNFRLSREQAAELARLADSVPAVSYDDMLKAAEATGVEAGLSGQIQIRIALQAMEDNGGSATMPQIYAAVESHMDGQRLSASGRASLRYFINTVAVKAGYVHSYDSASPGWHITAAGRALLSLPPDEQQASLDALEAEVRQGEVNEAAPDPLDGPAFVLIHKNYGPIYRFTRDAGGSPKRLIRALEEWQRSGKPIYAILYRPSPYKAFAAWAQVEQAEATDNGRTWTVTFAMHPFEPPIRVHRLLGAVSWLDPARNLAVAFRGISIRPIPSSDFHTILAATQTAQAPEPNTDPLPPEEPLEPIMFAAEGARFWRFNVGREHWGAAREHGLLIWEGVSTSQSAQRLRRIRPGDRIVAYIRGGQIGGIGMVTRVYRVEDPQGGSPAGIFGRMYLQRIGVLWAASPAEPVHVLEDLKDDAYTQLFERFKDPNAIVKLTREEYARILVILGVDDIEPPARLPHTWAHLADYVAFAQSLGDTPTEEADFELLAEASDLRRRIDHSPLSELPLIEAATARLHVDDLLVELRQLRLLTTGGDEHLRCQPYVAGNAQALTRLSALALLIEDAQQPGTFELPARAILPRLRTAKSPRPVGEFAPELGAEGELLLRWYAEAGLVTVAKDTWQMAPGALDPLSGDDPASIAYREVLEALLLELDSGSGPGLPYVRLDEALPPSPDLNARLAELGRDLLIDSAVIRRIYRSLMAGRHVVLSGPPGTGKTELARLLPTLLWREEPQTFQRLTTEPDLPPVVPTREERHGYLPIVVTATEDWGVRDVVGGIGPRLDGASGGLSYSIEHGALTRVVLQHFAGTDGGRRLPPPALARDRRDPIGEDGRRYRGAWLVIDEFTRAPIDAAFGSLLTTLGGGKNARLAVPTPAGDQHEQPLPRDFRIIGTLNSFDRHFLNQMSEAMKRRFDFIDVLPPCHDDAPYEQGLAALQALDRLRGNGFAKLGASGGWPGVLAIDTALDKQGLPRYVLGECQPESRDALDSFWRIFSAIRVFRQLGTAQIVAVYTNLFAGVLVSSMSWEEALDTALADALADQLQVLSRDEQRTIDAFLEHAERLAAFGDAMRAILGELPPARRAGYLHALQERAVALKSSVTIHVSEDASLEDFQIREVFALGAKLSLPTPSTFRHRLHDLIGERGL